METGRNAPCPCGSGRKYKKCCLTRLEPGRDSARNRLGEAYDRIESLLLRYAEKALGREGLQEAYEEFLLWPDEELDQQLLERQHPLFISWLLFNWVYEPDECDTKLDLNPGLTIAELFLRKEERRLDDAEIELIKTISGKPFSFFEVIRCDPGESFLLKDVLTGEEIEVMEQKGSASARAGDILYCRVVRIRNMALLYGCSSYAIPPDRKPAIIELRKFLSENRRKVTEQMLREYDFEIREDYLEISKSLFHLPVMVNTDGEFLNIHTIHYEIDSPDLAFSRLADLCVTETADELRTAAELNAAGGIARVVITWTRRDYRKVPELENTLLGSLVIEGQDLKAIVNSAERAERIRKEIETRLGQSAKYKTTVIQSTDYMLREQREVGSRKNSADPKHEELMKLPEVREKIAGLFTARWKNWIDEEIPALGGETPRQAVKNVDGRESVEALLLVAERNAAHDEHMSERYSGPSTM